MEHLNAETISNFLQEKGHISKMVIVRTDGKIEEVELDSTPAKNHLATLLGGYAVSIIGQWYQNGVVVLQNKEQTNTSLKENIHVLPVPFEKEKIKGDIALVRMNEQADIVDFSKSEYESFIKLDGKDIIAKEDEMSKKREEELEVLDLEEVPEVDEGEENEGEQNEEDIQLEDDEVPENPQEAFKEQLVTKIVSFYQEQYGRDPTVEEIKESMKKILLSMQNGATEEEEEEEKEKPNSNESEVKKDEKLPESKNEDKEESKNDTSETTTTTTEITNNVSSETHNEKRPLEDADVPEAKKAKIVG